MKTETKVFIGLLLVTVAIIAGGVFFISRSGNSQGPSSGATVDFARLLRDDSPRIASSSSDASPSAEKQASKVTLVEFADFQCPACSVYYSIVKQITTEFKSELTYVYRHYPLAQHRNARPAATAAEAAGKQGKFWEMHDLLYEKQSEWSAVGNPDQLFSGYAKEIGLDIPSYENDLKDKAILDKINRDVADGDAVGVNGTPTFFLNGENIRNPGSIDDFRTLIKAAILKTPKPEVSANEAYHIHSDYKVYVNGKVIDFSLTKYQSTEEKKLSEDTHLHDEVGEVLHIHKKGVTFAGFLASLGFPYTADCLTVDTGTKYCTDAGNSLKLFANGKKVNDITAYEPADLDRILLTYGSDSEAAIQTQIASVTDRACIFSEKCPERGTPPYEECVGGLGSGCVK